MDDTKWSTFVTSQAFDFDSIMIYNSYSGSVDEDDPKKWVLVRKDNKTPVWMGGNEDPTKASVSAGDIARVAQLCKVSHLACIVHTLMSCLCRSQERWQLGAGDGRRQLGSSQCDDPRCL